MRPVHRLVVGHALASVAMSLPWPLLLLLVFERHAGDLALGLTGAARMLPYVALSWLTGTLADRFARDRILMLTLVTRLALLAALTVALAHGALVVAVVAAAGAVACGTPAYPALAAALPSASSRVRRDTDVLVTVEVASFVVGPALGGLLLAPATRGYVGALALAGTAAALLVVRGVRLPAPARGAVRPSARAVLGAARRVGAVRRAVAVVAVLNGVLAATGLALLSLADAVWGRHGFGLATGVLGFGALAAPLLWWCGRSSASRTRLGLLAMAVALSVVPLAPEVLWALPGLAVTGAAAVHVESAVTATIQEAVPDGLRAGTLGLTDSVMVAAALLGSLAAPFLVSALGPVPLVVLLGLCCAAASVRPPAAPVTAAQVRIPQQRRAGQRV
jgi:MFS family permease